MTQFVRTTDEHFATCQTFTSRRITTWQDLRMHYVDEGPEMAP